MFIASDGWNIKNNNNLWNHSFALLLVANQWLRDSTSVCLGVVTTVHSGEISTCVCMLDLPTVSISSLFTFLMLAIHVTINNQSSQSLQMIFHSKQLDKTTYWKIDLGNFNYIFLLEKSVLFDVDFVHWLNHLLSTIDFWYNLSIESVMARKTISKVLRNEAECVCQLF